MNISTELAADITEIKSHIQMLEKRVNIETENFQTWRRTSS